jgi:malonyl CoA-acyl carrier protein transacylase
VLCGEIVTDRVSILTGGSITATPVSTPGSETAVVFPGQGAQRPGMGRDFFERFPVARGVFSEASDALGLDIGAVCFHDDERLHRTEFTQPAILVTEIAMLRVLTAETGVAPSWFGGHSLGEYTALCAAGAMPLDVAVRLVRQRGAVMQSAVASGHGAMVAVIAAGVNAMAFTEELVQIGVDIANRNSPDQIVLSGPTHAVARAEEALRERLLGSPHELVRLDVSAPFHSRGMRAVEAGLRSALLDALPRMAPERAVAVTSNLTGTFHRGEGMALVDALVGQASGPVDWIGNMRALAGVATTIYEVGPSRPLRAFFATIGREVISVTSTRSLRQERLA